MFDNNKRWHTRNCGRRGLKKVDGYFGEDTRIEVEIKDEKIKPEDRSDFDL